MLATKHKARMSYSCERLVIPDFTAYPLKTFRNTDASRLGSYDLIMIKSDPLIQCHNHEIEKCDRLT